MSLAAPSADSLAFPPPMVMAAGQALAGRLVGALLSGALVCNVSIRRSRRLILENILVVSRAVTGCAVWAMVAVTRRVLDCIRSRRVRCERMQKIKKVCCGYAVCCYIGGHRGLDGFLDLRDVGSMSKCPSCACFKT